jgi:ABC-2 type transport system permease protein
MSAAASPAPAATPPAAGTGGKGGVITVALAIAWRSLHTFVRRPDLFVPSLMFPLAFLASFAGGLTALGSLPGFRFPAGYTAFQFVFVLCQASMFSGLFTGFSLAFDFESGFAKRLMLAASDRRGIVLGYALVALSRAAITLTVVTIVAVLTGMQITGSGVDFVGLCALAALLVLVGFGWAAGVALRFKSIQAGPMMQTPVFLLLFLAPVYVPLPLLRGWIHTVAQANPATAFLDAGRGLISGVHDHTWLGYVAAAGLIAVFVVWSLTGLRSAERSGS